MTFKDVGYILTSDTMGKIRVSSMNIFEMTVNNRMVKFDLILEGFRAQLEVPIENVELIKDNPLTRERM